MCGIAGIIGVASPENQAALARMNDAMLHRGPDAEGIWRSASNAEDHAVLLAHRRLSILDLSPAGNQPMVDPQQGDALVLNGEIYNYRALRARLQQQGRQLRSSGDTEVLFHSLQLGGQRALNQLQGMFAIAFWDNQRQQLLLARDPLGMKPLYLARNPDPGGSWSIAFASEVRSLLASGLVARRLNTSAVQSIVWNGFTVAPESIIAGIESLLPGELRQYNLAGKELQRQRYWQLPRPNADYSDKAALAAKLQETVGLHLASDVPLGVFLSGGIDSSVVANLAARTQQGAVASFTLSFPEAEHDEGPVARQIATAIGTQHHELKLSAQDFISALDVALASLDQPSFDGLNSFFMSRAVRDAGFKVALVGSGGDELFGGYTSFRDLPRFRQLSAGLTWLPGNPAANLAAALQRRFRPKGRYPALVRLAQVPAMLACRGDLLSLYQLAYALFLPETYQQLLAETAMSPLQQGLPAAFQEALGAEVEGRTTLSSIAAFEQRLFLGERLLRDADMTSMASSIEMRLPLVDTELLTAVYAVPDRQRFFPIRRKQLLRDIGLIGLDPALFERPKRGFELPYNRWLRGELGTLVAARLQDASLVRRAGLEPTAVQALWRAFESGTPGLYWTRIWALYVLLDWCERHQVEAA